MNYSLVDIGIASSYDFFFEVAWPNYREVGKNPSPIAALNAAWPFWHLHEWYFWEHNPSASEKDLRRYVDQDLLQDCPELGWLRDIAEAGKHFKLGRTNPPVKVSAIWTREELSGTFGDAPFGTVPFGSGSGRELFVHVGSKIHRLESAMSAAFRYWLGKVLPHPVEVRLSPPNMPECSEIMLNWCRDRLGDEGVRKWRWTLLQGANEPHYVQRLAFLEADDANAFRCRFQVP